MSELAANPRLRKEAAAREAGLSTPLEDNAGMRMMLKWGGVPGLPLGSRDDSGALVEPLRPDTARMGGELHGLGYVDKRA